MPIKHFFSFFRLHRALWFIGCFTLAFTSFSAQNTPTSLRWEMRTIDLGTVTSYTPLSRAISFTNASHDIITIDSVRSTYPKASITVSLTQIMPRQQGQLSLQVFGFDQAGALGFPVFIYTTSGTDTLSITMIVQPPLALDPSILDTKKIFFGDTITMTSILHWKGPGKPAPSIMRFGSHITESVIETLGTDFILEAKIAPQTHDSIFQDTITLLTGNPVWPQHLLLVQGHVSSTFTAKPPVLDFGDISNTSKHTVATKLVTDRTGNFRVSKIESNPDYILVSTIVAPGKKGNLVATILPGERPRPFKGIIRVFINDNPVPDLEVPLKGRITE